MMFEKRQMAVWIGRVQHEDGQRGCYEELTNPFCTHTMTSS